jgi:hypothetical protein
VQTPSYRLIYVSQIAPLTSVTLEYSLRDILITSHLLNRRDGLTGFLIAYGSWFAQVLEGPEPLVDACYGRIAQDSRHVAPTVRERGPVAQQRFSRWTMCAHTLSPLDNALLQGSDINQGLNLWDAPAALILRMLEAIAERYADELDELHGRLGSRVEEA